jgi:putative transposase
MIEQTVEDLTTIIGTRPACRALGASPATIYRRRRPPAPRGRCGPGRRHRGHCRDPSVRPCSPSCTPSGSSTARPRQVWATLLDEGRYLASERTMYRLLAARHGGVRERRAQLEHPPYAAPELLAERPNEVWSWDIERHEASVNRAVMKGHRGRPVAAGRCKLGAA